MPDISTGLWVTIIGVSVVFGILSLLSFTVYLLKYLQKAESMKEKIELGKRVESSMEKHEEHKAKPEEHEAISGEHIPLITAAIIGFREYKRKMLEKYELFRDFPQLERILWLTGLFFEAEVKVSLGGLEKKIKVRETPSGYLVNVDDKTYNVSIQPKAVLPQ